MEEEDLLIGATALPEDETCELLVDDVTPEDDDDGFVD